MAAIATSAAGGESSPPDHRKDFPDLLAHVAPKGQTISVIAIGHFRRRQVRTRISQGNVEAALRSIRVAHPLAVKTLESETVATAAITLLPTADLAG
ncbi:MAG: hypothetical protein WA642_20995 [Steroidobacteraceae bacterium]